MTWPKLTLGCGVVLTCAAFAATNDAAAQVAIDIEAAPFRYSETPADNPVSRLIDDLANKKVKLQYDRRRGYLPAILEALDVPVSSQVLVFSKTSMQVQHISRRNPRAIYFNDEVYVGWVRGSTLMEISTADPKLGAAFYTVDMMPWRPKFEHATYDCLSCHATSMTQGIPGHTIRSVMPGFDGSVDAQKVSYVTDHASPLAQRWGGWYVTGKHGGMQHLGNTFLRGGVMDTSNNGNRVSLRNDFDTTDYLSPYSDIVALMVLEHQTQMHNTMTRADFTVRSLIADRKDEGPDSANDGSEADLEFNAQVAIAAKDVVDDLLLDGEAPLTEPIIGSVLFVDDFGRRGKRDSQGRSLRDFDLQTRLFEYPCSYLIHSRAFDSLQDVLRIEVLRQLSKRLVDQPAGAAIAEILRETKPEFKQVEAAR